MDNYLLQLGIITSLWMTIGLVYATVKFTYKQIQVDRTDKRAVDRVVRTTLWHDYKDHIFYMVFACYLAVALQMPAKKCLAIALYFLIVRASKGFWLLNKHPKRSIFLRYLGNIFILAPLFYVVFYCLHVSLTNYFLP